MGDVKEARAVERTVRDAKDAVAALYDFSTEETEYPSEGEPFTVARDPHLRLRRTLTPASPVKGIMEAEASFQVSGSSGRRVLLSFSWRGLDFQMESYAWGADEAAAQRRVVAVHGVTPSLSRTRFHQTAERLTALDPHLRVVVIDWYVSRPRGPTPALPAPVLTRDGSSLLPCVRHRQALDRPR